MATETGLVFALGETWEVDFELNDAEGVDLNLSGATVTFELWRGKVLRLREDSAGGEVAVESPAGGAGLLTVTPASQDAAGIIAAVYEYKLWATLQDGRRTLQAFGPLTVTA